MKFSKLMDNKGRQIERPEATDGSIFWDQKDGKAYAFGSDGKKLIATMQNTRVSWITAAGIRLEGVELIEGPVDRYIAMSWQVIF